MADFYGCLESSSFRVRDGAAFMADEEVQKIQAYAEGDGGFFESDGDYYAFGWYGQYPSTVISTDYDHEKQEAVELDIAEVIRRHIRPGDVCQIGISGNEKLRYIGGSMAWVTSKGTIYFDATTEPGSRLTEETLLQTIKRLFDDTANVLGPETGLKVVVGV